MENVLLKYSLFVSINQKIEQILRNEKNFLLGKCDLANEYREILSTFLKMFKNPI
jgi:hypothetical protein